MHPNIGRIDVDVAARETSSPNRRSIAARDAASAENAPSKTQQRMREWMAWGGSVASGGNGPYQKTSKRDLTAHAWSPLRRMRAPHVASMPYWSKAPATSAATSRDTGA